MRSRGKFGLIECEVLKIFQNSVLCDRELSKNIDSKVWEMMDLIEFRMLVFV